MCLKREVDWILKRGGGGIDKEWGCEGNGEYWEEHLRDDGWLGIWTGWIGTR